MGAQLPITIITALVNGSITAMETASDFNIRLTSDLVNNEFIKLDLSSNSLADGSISEAGSMAPITLVPLAARRVVVATSLFQREILFQIHV